MRDANFDQALRARSELHSMHERLDNWPEAANEDWTFDLGQTGYRIEVRHRDEHVANIELDASTDYPRDGEVQLFKYTLVRAADSRILAAELGSEKAIEFAGRLVGGAFSFAHGG